jgi:beta-lactam-binding protein with PASTA domain
MPDLVGFSFRSAQMELSNLGLRLGDTTYEPSFDAGAVRKQLCNGGVIAPGTKIRMGSTISFVLGSGVGSEKFIVPSLIGMTFGQAKALLQSNGLDFASIIAPGITDTLNAYIYKQIPERYDEEKHFQYIRSGQTMDVWLRKEPVSDSLTVPLKDE